MGGSCIMKRTIGVIKSCYPSFTKSEKVVADFILEKSSEIDSLTLLELSEVLNVGEATIIRFCRKINLKGYQELKFMLAIDGEEDKSKDIDKHEAIKEHLIKTIQLSDSMLKQSEINKAVKLINEAKGIYFYGIGTSGLSACMGESRLFRYGKHTKAITDSHIQCMQSSLCDSHSLIIAVSVSGETIDLLEAVQGAKENGCKLIAITNHINSTLARLSDIVFISHGETSIIRAGTFSSMVSQMFILDILTSGYAIAYPNKITKPREKTVRSVISKTKE